MIRDNFGLYVILTNPVAGYMKSAEAAVKAGVSFLQLRMKDTPYKEVLEMATLIRGITTGTNTKFIVNDDVRIAAEAYADGVHLGQNDMPIAEARDFWQEPGKIYGLSTHSEEQAQLALSGEPDYIGVGPVYKTPTKVIPDPVLGLDRMGAIIRAVPLPAIAIGGINETNLHAVLQAGAQNFSVVRPIMESHQPYVVIKEFQAMWEDFYVL